MEILRINVTLRMSEWGRDLKCMLRNDHILEAGGREEPVKVAEKQVKEVGGPDQCSVRKARSEWLHNFPDPVQKGKKARSFVKKSARIL